MVNYLSKLSELAEPIRELSKDKVPFNWGPEHPEVFKQMKTDIARAPILAYYNPIIIIIIILYFYSTV